MTNIIEDPYVERWIFTRLNESAIIAASAVGTKVFRGQLIPQSNGVINLPCIRFFKGWGFESRTLNWTRIFNRLFYTIEVCSAGESNRDLMAVANELDTVIGIRNVQHIVEGVCNIEYSRRIQTISRELEDNGTKFQFLGGVYEISAKAI